MIPKADFIVKEVTPPHGNWCKSGHTAPTTFRRAGPDGADLPTRFFQVTSDQNAAVSGVYCEPCLILAHAMQRNEVGVRPR